ncbi:hypothetical protein VTP01DRAFT_497 [Rhizomucor pusillus]|uniref:uncharacterized protein n=1 Tax=Rhizomucor pusillus TaxID=4840 RepID=UPI0037422216
MYRRKHKKREQPTFPDTLEGFGYRMKETGEIRSFEDDTHYNFEHRPKDRPYNELRYKAFVGLIGDFVEQKLQQEPLSYQKTIIPVNADPSKDIHSYIFMTPNALTTTDKLLILIPGNNTRIGQWTRRAMCDENVFTGSMIEVSKMAKERGYEIMILNPNGIYWFDNKAHEMPPLTSMDFLMVPENESPEEHCQYVFRHFISKAKATKIAFMTLGWGGQCFAELMNQNFEFIKSRVLAVAMADSVHSRELIKGDDMRAWMQNHIVNWVVSKQPRGEIVSDNRFGCECLSAETELSDFTLPYCVNEMMRFIGLKMGDIQTEEDVDEEISCEELLEAENAELGEHLNVVSIG